MRALFGILAVTLSIAGCSPKGEQNGGADNATVAAPAPPPAPAASVAPPVYSSSNSPAPLQGTAPAPIGVPQAPPPPTPVIRKEYKCPGGSAFVVEFKQAPSRAEILIGKNTPIVLIQQSAEQGFFYKNAQYELYGKSTAVRLNIQGHPPMICNTTL